MSIRVAINGFGRIGRLVLRAALASKNKDVKNLEWVAVNDLSDAKTLAHLLEYDSTFGRLTNVVGTDGQLLTIDGQKIEVCCVREPKDLPWSKLRVDYVVESTGRFTDAAQAQAHLEAGAKRIVISAPATGDILTVCMGINHEKYDPSQNKILSNASCTTNCLAPLAKILHESLSVERGYMLTIHSFTNDQPVLDFQHKDLRRARAAGQSMIPTSTGAAKAIGLVVPELSGKLNGIAIRVPTPDVSLVSLCAHVGKATGKEEVNQIFLKASRSKSWRPYLDYNQGPLVSKDFQGNPASCVFDGTLTEVVDGTLVNIYGWYDNEWGYSNRVVDLLAYMASREPKLSSVKNKTVAAR